MLESKHSDNNSIHHLSLEKLTSKQWLNVKEPIVDTNNRFNRVFLSFNPFSPEFASGDRFIYLFSSCFSFHSLDWKNKENRKAHICKLDEITF